MSIRKKLGAFESIMRLSWFGRKVLMLFSFIFSSLIIYMIGYLFLWGYYFGGNEDYSLLSMAINFIPINRPVAILIGLFYLLTLIIAGFLLVSFFNEGFSLLKLFFMALAIIITNEALVLFFYGETNFNLFIKMLKLWGYPFLVIVVIAYCYAWIKYPATSIKVLIYTCLLMFNAGLISIIYPRLNNFIVPELFIILFYFGLPALIKIKDIQHKSTKLAIKFFLYVTAMIPLFPIVVSRIIDNIIINILISLILSICLVVISENNLHQKWAATISKKGIKKEIDQKGEKAPFFIEKPLASSMFLISIIIIVLEFSPNFLIRGGDYFQSIVSDNRVQKISYSWDGKTESVEGILVSSNNNIFYISTSEQKLLIVKTDYLKAD